MDPKLSKLKNKKLTYSEVIDTLNEIERLYIKVMNRPRSEWSERANQCLDELRMTVICQQTPEIENLERQYESKNSLEKD